MRNKITITFTINELNFQRFVDAYPGTTRIEVMNDLDEAMETIEDGIRETIRLALQDTYSASNLVDFDVKVTR
jgi:hypothetical protein